MAEGWVRHLHSDILEPYSAGLETHGIDPNAVLVMSEAGVDISKQKSQQIKELMNIDIDVVITVCSHAHENCPVFPKKCTVIHSEFNDPPKIARELYLKGSSEKEQLNCYRKVRDEIKNFVKSLPKILNLPK
jgi:arsenate reductase